MREPDKIWEIPLWETNHSKQRLLQEEAMDFLSYKLGYEMSEETDDPTRTCLLYTSPSPRDGLLSRMPSSA